MKKFIFLSMLLSANTQAEIPINAGLSGLWHDNEKPGQGLLLDVIEANNSVFAGWFTYRPSDNSDNNHYWLTSQGPYDGSLAELTLYKTSNGAFNQSSETENTSVGFAQLHFNSCTEATFSFELNQPDIQNTITLSRVTPDVFCIERINSIPEPNITEYNYPPVVSQLQTEYVENGIRLTFNLDDTENDTLDLKVMLVSAGELIYEIPSSYLSGHVNFPVLTGQQKTIRWHHLDDIGFQQLHIDSFQIKVVADDRYLNTMQDIIDSVSEERIIADIRVLEGVRHHQASPAGLIRARKHILSQMSKQPLNVTEQSFNHLNSIGINLIGTLEATEPTDETYIIDGHYDTVASTPGADDNASGTAGMLEAMRVLSQFNTLKNIKFIAFDKEELGLVGSRFHAASLSQNELITGLINFEMIGYTCSDQAECINFPNADTSIYNIKSSFADTLSETFMTIGATHVPELKITSVTDDGDRNFRRSDHAPFWDLGIDALFLTDGANFRTPHYHQQSDQLPTLDTHFMTQVVKVAVGTLAKSAEIHHTGYALSDTLQLTDSL